MRDRTLLVLSGGHPYETLPFEELLANLTGWRVRHLVHPDAEAAVAEGAAKDAAAILFYDMPGFAFANGKVTARAPSAAYRAAILDHFAQGRGATALHHAIAGWASWPEWSELIGGRFLYSTDKVRGVRRIDSGYRHEVTYAAELIGEHPVTAGLPLSFSLTDELYLGEVFADTVTPLLRARHEFVANNFYSAAHAVAGRMFSNVGWRHPPGSDLIGWTKPAGAGRMVYLQPGDGPLVYANPQFRRLLGNSLEWCAGD